MPKLFVPSLLGLALCAIAGCTSQGVPAQGVGYLASDHCLQYTNGVGASACGAQPGCTSATVPAAGKGAATSVCVAQDPCLALDASHCASDSSCAWSTIATLCPINADCSKGGFCHARTDVGGDCACVSPIACPLEGPCAKVECDCSGNGSVGGGACACACPACAPGESCPPCDCNCVAGGGCGTVGTCACACPACPPGQACPPCDCTCGSGGGTTISTDPCSQFTDANTCEHNGKIACSVPLNVSATFKCVSLIANQTTPPTPTVSCACACPACPAGSSCAPCNCGTGSCGTGTTDGGVTGTGSGSTSPGCIPPSPPTTTPTPIACPGLGCAPSCPNGVKIGADGCPTCQCL